jgi:hypothetical protein
MTVYLMIFLPKIPYIHRIYMVLANPTLKAKQSLLPVKQILILKYYCIRLLLRRMYYKDMSILFLFKQLHNL